MTKNKVIDIEQPHLGKKEMENVPLEFLGKK